MVRNLIGLFVLVVLMIAGFAWYHTKSIKPIKALPLALYHWEDSTGRATVRDVIQSADFKLAPQQRHNFGYTESIHWFRFTISADKLPEEFTLELRNHTINYADLIAVRNGRIVSFSKTGDKLLFSKRPIPSKVFAYPIFIDEHQRVDYFLRLDKRYESLATSIILWHTSDFEDKEQREYFLWGIFAGVVILVVLLNFIFWATTRDLVYLWYAIYVLALSLRQFADSGLGFQYLWPNLPDINSPDPVIQSLWLYVPAMFQFQQYFLNLRETNKWLFTATQVLKYVFWFAFTVLVILQLMGIPQQHLEIARVVIRTHALLANISFIVFIWVIIVGLRSGEELKQLYAGGFALQMAGQMLNIIQNLMRSRTDGVFFVDPYLIIIVIFFIDLVVFAYLLAFRYRQSISQNQQLTIGLAQAQQETNQKIIEVLDSERLQIYNLLLSDVGHRLQEAQRILANVASSPILSDSIQLIKKVDNDLGQIAQNRLPVEVAEKGLLASFSELIKHLNLTQTVRFTCQQTGPKPELPIIDEIHIYRIGNELINNVIKHAYATEATVVLATETTGFSLTVSDNGRGFDTASVTVNKGGIGVRNLYARARQLNAEVSMNSGVGGTTISVFIPSKNTN